ncbi:radical SAM protein, partial [candidate division WOR-3 bacterium]|nr:radical SAM protein [candidate division WOR-3 bacterium]
MCILFNLGCKLNQYEGYCLQKKLSTHHNIVIVNTCCVTAEAAQKSRKKFHRAVRLYPGHKVIATGCACTLYPEEYAQAHQVMGTIERNRFIAGIYPEQPRSRYFLKIQDGCTEPCTYCIVSVIRHQLSSTPVARIKDEIAWARAHDFREIVLVGANIGLYGAENGNSLAGLLFELQKIHELPRIRLSSIEPRFISDDVLAAMQSLPMCRHFHVPVQSGDDKVLARMGRTYTNHDLRERINALARVFPDAAIGVDVIVGFPDEDDICFSDTKNLMNDLPITHAHVFPYSPRPGTAAFEYGDPVSYGEKKRRLWELKRLVAEKNLRFRQNLVGHDVEVIVVQSTPVCIGLTDNYVRIELDRSFAKGTL